MFWSVHNMIPLEWREGDRLGWGLLFFLQATSLNVCKVACSLRNKEHYHLLFSIKIPGCGTSRKFDLHYMGCVNSKWRLEKDWPHPKSIACLSLQFLVLQKAFNQWYYLKLTWENDLLSLTWNKLWWSKTGYKLCLGEGSPQPVIQLHSPRVQVGLYTLPSGLLHLNFKLELKNPKKTSPPPSLGR